MKRVDLLLLYPLSPSLGGEQTLPLGLLSVAAYARRNGFSVRILARRLRKLKTALAGYDLTRTMVGFSATTDNVCRSMELCAWIKGELCPQAYCVIGGVHATCAAEEVLATSTFDCVVQGEGEITLVELLRAYAAKREGPFHIAGTCEREVRGTICRNESRALIEDLGSLPPPAYDLVDFELWRGFIRCGEVHRRRVGYIVTSRGCPFDCVFCGSKTIWSRKLRFFPVQTCVDLIESLVERYRLDGICFLDDEFVVQKKRLLQTCEEMRKRGLHRRIVWEAHATVGASDEDVFRVMRESGCLVVRMGLESGSSRTLKFLKKGAATVEQNYEAVAKARRAGLHAFGSFIIGSPDEEIDDIVQTIQFIRTSGLTDCAVFVAVPYPGTDLHAVCRDRGYFRPGLTYNDYRVEGSGASAIIRNRCFSAEQLAVVQRFINISVVANINHGRPVPDLDYAAELEAIRQGDFSRVHETVTAGLGRRLEYISSLARAALLEPQRVLFHLTR